MNKATRFSANKRPTNISLPVDLIEEARRLGINVSQSCEAGLRQEVSKSLGEKWQRENMEAIESSNEYVRNHGLPLARYRDLLWRS